MMDFYSARSELQRMAIKEVLRTAANQKLQKCMVINKLCRFYFRHRNFGFCVTEISGASCEIERLDNEEEVVQTGEETTSAQSLFRKPEEK